MTDPTDTVIAYATPASNTRPPFDWAGCFRQAVFALGVGCITFGITLYLVRDDRRDGPIYAFFIGAGVALVTLTLPWPGRIGRRRSQRGEA